MRALPIFRYNSDYQGHCTIDLHEILPEKYNFSRIALYLPQNSLLQDNVSLPRSNFMTTRSVIVS